MKVTINLSPEIGALVSIVGVTKASKTLIFYSSITDSDGYEGGSFHGTFHDDALYHWISSVDGSMRHVCVHYPMTPHFHGPCLDGDMCAYCLQPFANNDHCKELETKNQLDLKHSLKKRKSTTSVHNIGERHDEFTSAKTSGVAGASAGAEADGMEADSVVSRVFGSAKYWLHRECALMVRYTLSPIVVNATSIQTDNASTRELCDPSQEEQDALDSTLKALEAARYKLVEYVQNEKIDAEELQNAMKKVEMEPSTAKHIANELTKTFANMAFDHQNDETEDDGDSEDDYNELSEREDPGPALPSQSKKNEEKTSKHTTESKKPVVESYIPPPVMNWSERSRRVVQKSSSEMYYENIVKRQAEIMPSQTMEGIMLKDEKKTAKGDKTHTKKGRQIAQHPTKLWVTPMQQNRKKKSARKATLRHVESSQMQTASLMASLRGKLSPLSQSVWDPLSKNPL